MSKRRYTVLRLRQKLQDYYDKMVENLALGKYSRVPKEFQPVLKPELDEALKKVLTRLKELKYLNDTDYAKDFIEGRTLSSRPRGKFMLRRELKTKGIHPELIEKILDETELDEEAIATETLKKRMKLFEKHPPRKQKEKAMRFLASRGFKFDSIYKAVQSCYNDRSSISE